jgi:broad specificity phosphatase PhoE
MLKRDFTFLLFILLLAFTQQALAADNSADEAVWSTLRSGQHVVLIRHAITEPGIGDPPGFVHGKCSTQRNLSAQGRLDAKRIGEAFRSRNIPISDVLSSRWCRCLDTANLAFGKATPSPMLDSMFNDREKPADEKVREVFAAVNRRPSSGNLVLITHNQNIQALTGVSPASGEMVVVTPENGKFRVIGRLNLSS